MENYKTKFDKRTQAHIDRVCKYGKLLGKDYVEHDRDKFTDLYDGYSLMSKNKEDITAEEQTLIDNATKMHVLNNEHHPEHWADPEAVEGFTRNNPTPHGPVDCTEMPNDAIEEMCCDWCAMSEEFKNSPFEWFEKVNGSRWVFSDEQQSFITDTLTKLWKDADIIQDKLGAISYLLKN